MKVVISEPIAQSGKNYLLERGYQIVDQHLKSREELKEAIKDCDGLLIRILKCDKEVLETATKLRVIGKHGVGVDNIDIDYCTQKKIQVTFTPTTNSNSVAEHVIFLMLGCARNTLTVNKRFLSDGDFDIRSKLHGIQLAGKTVGILGLGRIGRNVAQKCIGMGMKVISYDPYVTQEQAGNDITMMDRDSVLKNADFVSMNLPCTDETRYAFGAREFSLMKETAFFINCARGALVRESDLVKALQDKVIRGAGIDAYEQEPPDQNSPLFQLENAFLTPHYAGSTIETTTLTSLHAAMGVDEVLSGKKISWPYNKL